MRQIRRGVFETNSSSVHSMTMCSGEEFKKFQNGEVWHITDNWCLPDRFSDREWITPEEARQVVRENTYYDGPDPSELDDDEVCAALDRCVETYENIGNGWYESFENSYITPGGEEVYAFGYYGYD